MQHPPHVFFHYAFAKAKNIEPVDVFILFIESEMFFCELKVNDRWVIRGLALFTLLKPAQWPHCVIHTEYEQTWRKKKNRSMPQHKRHRNEELRSKVRLLNHMVETRKQKWYHSSRFLALQ